MRMLQLAIIDDEPKIRSFLNAILLDQMQNVAIVGEASSVKTGLQLIRNKQPQVILLDVEMGDGTGFDLLSQLGSHRPHVIFVTAYDHYAVQALRADAIDYIEKPVNLDELTAALKKVMQLVKDNVQPAYGNLLQSVKSKIKNKIVVPSRSGLLYFDASEVVCIKADGTYAQFFTEGTARPFIISRTLKEIQPALEQLGFIRLHRSYLVNASKIQELNKTDGGFVILSNGMQVPFSRQYKEDVMRLIKDLTTFL